MNRRSLLLAASGAVAVQGLRPATGRAAASGLKFGPPSAFSFERLRALAAARAASPYAAPPPPPAVLHDIDYDGWGKIHFDTDKALFADSRLPVTFFHLGRFFQRPVRMFAVEGGMAREVVYDPGYFRTPADSPARRLPDGVGFAGFRVQEPRDGRLDWRTNDWVAFLGASYFRAIGELYQYGLSARAVAIDTAVSDRPEEFPGFTEVYIERPGPAADAITVHALLEGPSIVGACRFRMTRGKGVVMEVDQLLHLRRDVARLGLAPLTSMFWYSETAKPGPVDWRPEVHDSDGLAMWTGRGERLWRPLNNPSGPAASAFADEHPKGFGLLQRDRVFDHYLDGVMYDRRPSLWVEPRGDWGKGAVQLIELPTDSETSDNVVAAWVPDGPAQAGRVYDIGYTLYWLADEPHPTELARCVATRLGLGGQVGAPRPPGVRKFVVEFLGGPLAALPEGLAPEAVIDASRGRITGERRIEAVPDGVPGHWRVEFDLAATGAAPVELRLQLAVRGKAASEVWMHQHRPA